MNGFKKWVLALTFTIVPLYANADSVTYDFTGVITSSSGDYGSFAAGGVVTGSYTFDLGKGIASQGIGQVGSTSNAWLVQAYGGSVYTAQGTPALPTGLVFSSTINYSGRPGVTAIYSTPSISGIGVASDVAAENLNSPSQPFVGPSTIYRTQ
jgi:hypothetical protein